MQASPSEKADIGVYGLGVMGTSLARNFARNGFKVAVYNYEMDVTRDFINRYGVEGTFIPTFSEDEFAGELSTPRVALLMVTAGKVTEQVTRQLADVFEAGDIIVDMGNSHFPDTRTREQALRQLDLHFVGCGTSGGQEGALHGPSLMVGGSEHAFKRLQPMFTTISAKAGDGTPCCAHTGTDGAGHFVKMIHNGIEYADMQLISEAYSLLRYGAGLSPSEIADVFFMWNEGELSSYLIQCSAQILAHKDADTGKPFIDIIDDRAGQKGTGLWTVKEALDLGIPLTGIAEATLVRMLSGQSAERIIASRAFDSLKTEDVQPIESADRQAFIDAVGDALYASKIIAYSQGFDALQAGAKKYGWKMDLAEVAKVWRAGCIIRAQFLDKIAAAYADEGLELLMASEHFADRIRSAYDGWRKTVVEAVQRGIAIPAFTSSLAYFDAIRKERMGTALVQSQRDFFGAHTYRRVDKEGVYHTLWADDMSEIRMDK
ncbi:MAG: NADP-dependent phosphogluconate dehydrogenase [Actinomycetaceae bacterium]|nr:NADP-dependent phosphogluconate dehydrogenase [Actinomycetaceae bacterium]